MSGQEEKSSSFGSAIGWAMVMNWGQEGLTAVTTMLLAYLLGPEAFGLVAMALAYIFFIELFVGQGFSPAIVQRKTLEDGHLNAAFFIVLSLSAVLVVLSILLSEWWSTVCQTPDLEPVILVLSISIPMRGLTVVQEAVQSRAMRFKDLAVARTSSVLAGAVVGIGLAFAGVGVWALVAQHLVRTGWLGAVLWYRSNWWPGIRCTWQQAWPLIHFSARSFPATLLDFTSRYAEIFILGALFGPMLVGLFRLANRLVDMANQLVTKALWLVAFPYFSKAQDDRNQLHDRLADCIRLAGAFSVPLLVTLASVSPWLLTLLGPEWQPAVTALQILCLHGVVRAFAIFAGPVLQAVNKPQILSVYIGIYCAAICAAAGATGVFMQEAPVADALAAVAAARVAATLLVYLPLAVYFYAHHTGLRPLTFVALTGPGLGASIASAGAMFATSRVLPIGQLPPIVLVMLLGSVAGLVTVAVLLALDARLRTWARAGWHQVRQRAVKPAA